MIQSKFKVVILSLPEVRTLLREHPGGQNSSLDKEIPMMVVFSYGKDYQATNGSLQTLWSSVGHQSSKTKKMSEL
jgi:hypothetical protein